MGTPVADLRNQLLGLPRPMQLSYSFLFRIFDDFVDMLPDNLALNHLNHVKERPLQKKWASIFPSLVL
jgi:hypothetical protein